jgi:peptidyl-dipeptidase Dcp
LVSWDDVTTMFHEFGHALHGMFAAQTYPTISGTSVARDFVEFPSQFNENWALDPKILPHYAVHYQTGQPIPADLVKKILAARTFNQGYEVGEALEAARLDLDWHSLAADASLQDVDKFEAEALAKGGFDTKDVPPRYRSAISSTSGAMAIPRAIMPMRGRGCSDRMPSTGSRPTAA